MITMPRQAAARSKSNMASGNGAGAGSALSKCRPAMTARAAMLFGLELTQVVTIFAYLPSTSRILHYEEGRREQVHRCHGRTIKD